MRWKKVGEQESGFGHDSETPMRHAGGEAEIQG